MKISTKLLLTVASLALVAAPSVSVAENNQEVSVGALAFMPQDGLFDTGLGGAINYRYWFSPDWAITVGFGAAHVGVKDNRVQIAPGTAGSFDLLPLGFDLTYNLIDLDPVRLNLNLGLRYAFISSSATCLAPFISPASSRLGISPARQAEVHTSPAAYCARTP